MKEKKNHFSLVMMKLGLNASEYERFVKKIIQILVSLTHFYAFGRRRRRRKSDDYCCSTPSCQLHTHTHSSAISMEETLLPLHFTPLLLPLQTPHFRNVRRKRAHYANGSPPPLLTGSPNKNIMPFYILH